VSSAFTCTKDNVTTCIGAKTEDACARTVSLAQPGQHCVWCINTKLPKLQYCVNPKAAGDYPPGLMNCTSCE
jgi:hypothetical protein